MSKSIRNNLNRRTGQEKPSAAKAEAIKEVFWISEQIGDFRRPPFSKEAKEECAALLRRLQNGENLGMPQSRPMPSVAASCHELRVRDAQANWRLIHFVDNDAVIVLHVFAKKTQATPQSAIKISQARLKKYQAVRAHALRLKKQHK